MTLWTNYGNGTWSTGTNWTGGVVPDGTASTAEFTTLPGSGSTNALVGITAGTSITVGSLTMAANTFGRYTIRRSSTGTGDATLNFNAASGEANVTITGSGTSTIGNFSASQRLNINLVTNTTFGIGFGSLLATDSLISGSGRLALTSGGTLEITRTTANTYSGGTEIRSGTIGIGASGALGTGAILFGGSGGFGVSSVQLIAHANATLTNNISFQRDVNPVIAADTGVTLTLDPAQLKLANGGRTITFGSLTQTGTVVFGGPNSSFATFSDTPDVRVAGGTLSIGGFTGRLLIQEAETTTVDSGAVLELTTTGSFIGELVNNGSVRTTDSSLDFVSGLSDATMTGTFVGAVSRDRIRFSSADNRNHAFNLSAATFSNWTNGFDQISITSGSGSDYLTGSNWFDTISSGNGNDVVSGEGGSDIISLGSGNDFGLGGSGNDRISGGSGSNYIDSGTGYDFADYATSSSTVTITRLSNTSWQVSGSGFTDTVLNTEVLHFTDRNIALRERIRTDLDGNDTSDLILQSGTTLASWTMANGAATGATSLATIGAGSTVIGTGDFDGDGATDLLVRSGSTFFAWTVTNGTVTAGTAMGVPGSFNFVGAGDFNCDGTTDVLLFDGSQLLAWSVTNGQATGASTIGVLGSGFTVAGTGDFNGDGTTDVLLQNGSQLAVWDIVNRELVGGAVIGDLGAGWSLAGTGDFNGDGTTDLLLRNGSTLADWIIGNNAIVATNVIGSADPSFAVVGTGDYNGDGTADIAFQGGGQVIDWLMNGGTLSTGVFAGTSGGFTVVA